MSVGLDDRFLSAVCEGALRSQVLARHCIFSPATHQHRVVRLKPSQWRPGLIISEKKHTRHATHGTTSRTLRARAFLKARRAWSRRFQTITCVQMLPRFTCLNWVVSSGIRIYEPIIAENSRRHHDYEGGEETWRRGEGGEREGTRPLYHVAQWSKPGHRILYAHRSYSGSKILFSQPWLPAPRWSVPRWHLFLLMPRISTD